MKAQTAYVDWIAQLGPSNVPPGGQEAFDRVMAGIDLPVRHAMDVGCNTGWATTQLGLALPQTKVLGVDLSPGMIRAAKTRAARANAGNVRFKSMNAEDVDTLKRRFDLVVSAGSSAFFSRPGDVLSAIAASLASEGQFIDMHYVYEKTLSKALMRAEERSFGIKHVENVVQTWLRRYRRAGLALHSYRLLPRYFLPRRPGAEVYRSVLASLPGMGRAVEELSARRALIDELSEHRRPAIFVLRSPQTPGGYDARESDLATTVKVLNAFSAPYPRQSIESIRGMSPYDFLAYIGDPDCAPGGGRSVKAAATMLLEAGLTSDARVLDVGSFTGLSTFLLAAEFEGSLGVDYEAKFVDIARKLGARFKSPAKFKVMDARSMSFAAATFDAVVMTATTGYTSNPELMLKESTRVLKPGGLLVEFIYDYPKMSASQRSALRASVSGDLTFGSLADRLTMFRRCGLLPERIERVSSVKARDARLEQIHHYLIGRERQHNQQLDRAALEEFGMLARCYVTRSLPSGPEPGIYLCMFRKTL